MRKKKVAKKSVKPSKPIKPVKKKENEITSLVEKCIKIAQTKLRLARYMGIEWTTVDRWTEGKFRPSIRNYFKLLEIIKKGKIDE